MVVPFHSNRFESNKNTRITCCNADLVSRPCAGISVQERDEQYQPRLEEEIRRFTRRWSIDLPSIVACEIKAIDMTTQSSIFSCQDYENDSHGKEIILQRTTIKIPGSNKPRIALRSASNENKLNDLTTSDGAVIISNSSVTPGRTHMLTPKSIGRETLVTNVAVREVK